MADSVLFGSKIKTAYVKLLCTYDDAGIPGAGTNTTRIITGNDDDATALYLSNDRVGIMTATPSETLDVNGNVKSTGLKPTNLTDKLVPFYGTDKLVNGNISISGICTGIADGQIPFTPTRMFHVSSQLGATSYIKMSNTTTMHTATDGFDFKLVNTNMHFKNLEVGGKISFHTDGGSGNVERGEILADGTLDWAEPIKCLGTITINNDGGEGGQVNLGPQDTYDKLWKIDNYQDNLRIFSDDGVDTEVAFQIQDDGNFAIGRSNFNPSWLTHIRETTEPTANQHSTLGITGIDSGTIGNSSTVYMSASNVQSRGALISAEMQNSDKRHDLVFLTSNSSASPGEVMRLTGEKRVIIGGESGCQAEAFLEVRDTTIPLQLATSDYNGTSVGSRLRFSFSGSSGNQTMTIQATDEGGTSAADLYIQKDSGNTIFPTSCLFGENAVPSGDVKVEINGGTEIEGGISVGEATPTIVTISSGAASVAQNSGGNIVVAAESATTDTLDKILMDYGSGPVAPRTGAIIHILADTGDNITVRTPNGGATTTAGAIFGCIPDPAGGTSNPVHEWTLTGGVHCLRMIAQGTYWIVTGGNYQSCNIS